jgi:cytochrome c
LSFNNQACLNCPVNKQSQPGTPNQMTRAISIPAIEPNCADGTQAVDNVRRLNVDVRTALTGAGSIFRFYELVNTQWPVPVPHSSSTPQPETVFTVRPLALGNTTMESFVQPTSTCMGCHSTARTVNANNFVSSDFSFTLNNAQPLQTSCKIIPPPAKPNTAWDRQHWAGIMRGYALATHTYELLPAFVPTAKLHCASCHLAAGGNSDAAWWADLNVEYPTKPLLQARINHCFTNSLNGNALCTPAGNGVRGNCDSNASMITGSSGNATAGHQVFIQKCAVCHGLDGQGRYENNTYFRPALWGPHSFNQAAGMFSSTTALAQFLRWNMPLMAGGELSDQEAWDVEAYIHSKPRPQSP